jgi:general secretion pathway protein E
LHVINTPEKKIITLEDPVEYQLKGVNQIQVNPRIGLTFANGLRSVVRQDPDVILVGEIRDAETARIAVQSALTGHLLFSTLHTNDAAGAVTRLLDMEVEHFLLATTLLAVLAQRLVRVICPDCKAEVRPSEREIRSLNLSAAETEAALSQRTLLYAGAGCPACRNTGFRGRTGLFEQLPVTDTIRQEIHRRATAQQIRTVALSEKMTPLREDGWRKAKAGITTVSEILRVTLNP